MTTSQPTRTEIPVNDLGGGRQVEPVGPAWVGGSVAEHPPGRPAGRHGGGMQTPAELGWRFVALCVVAPRTRRYDVFPSVLTTPAAWYDVVDGLRRTTAVGAVPAVPG